MGLPLGGYFPILRTVIKNSNLPYFRITHQTTDIPNRKYNSDKSINPAGSVLFFGFILILLTQPQIFSPGSILRQVMWDSRWTKWHWGSYSPGSLVSPTNSHSTNCSTFINLSIISILTASLNNQLTPYHPTFHMRNYTT
jgi:hypothetical protein